MSLPLDREWKLNLQGRFWNSVLILPSPVTRIHCSQQRTKRFFVAGDASGESVIAIQALATGRRAAQSVIRFLRGEDLRFGRELKDTWTYETKLQMPVDWDAITGQREDMQELDPKKRIHSFDEVALGYTKEEAEREAARCRQCECKLCMKECIMLMITQSTRIFI